MSRRSDAPELTVISWRDIPAQVTARRGRQTVKRELPSRFQVAIDRAAMVAGLADADDYLTEWRRDTRPCDGNLEEVVAAEADRIESTWSSDVLNTVANNGGHFV